MTTHTISITHGRKNERTLDATVPLPSTLEGWQAGLGIDRLLEVLTEWGCAEAAQELRRLMRRNPDLTKEEADKHFATIFRPGVDMAKLEKAQALRAELAALEASA